MATMKNDTSDATSDLELTHNIRMCYVHVYITHTSDKLVRGPLTWRLNRFPILPFGTKLPCVGSIEIIGMR